MQQNEILLSVVIPYFQREKGILPKAIHSALGQEGFDAFDIIVVDDESPVPAEEEIADLIAAHPGRIRIIHRPNGGCGAARNTALDSLPKDRRYVALLDSDDEWEPHHLASAVAVLEREHDFYFANLFHIDKDVSRFDHEVETQYPTRLRPEEMREIEGLAQCYTFWGDMFDRTLFSGNLIMPSTVVYRFDKYPDFRFQVEYRNVGEEYLFFAGMAQLGATFAFSWRPSVRCGHGVNVFEKSGWGTPNFLKRLSDELKFRRYAKSIWQLNDGQRIRAREQLAGLRRTFARAFPGYLMRKQFSCLGDLVRFSRLDPAFPILMPFLLIGSILRKSST